MFSSSSSSSLSLPHWLWKRSLGVWNGSWFRHQMEQERWHRHHHKNNNGDFNLNHDFQIAPPHKMGCHISSLCMDRTEGRFLLSGASDATLCIYDFLGAQKQEQIIAPVAQTLSQPRQQHHQQQGHASSIVDAQWHTLDTGAFVSSSRDGTMIIWETESMQPITSWRPFESSSYFQSGPSTLDCMQQSPSLCGPSSNLVAVGSSGDATIKLVDLRSGASSHSLVGSSGGGGITSVAWSPTCQVLLASASTRGVICLWDVRKAGSRAALTCLNQYNTKTTSDWIATEQQEQHFDAQYFSHLRKQQKYNSSKNTGKQQQRKRKRTVHNNDVGPNNYQWIEEDSAKSHDASISGMDFTLDGLGLVSTATDGEIHSWDLRGGQLNVQRFFPPSSSSSNSSSSRQSIKVRYDHVWVTAGDQILQYSLEFGGQPTLCLTGHLGAVTSLETMDDSMMLLSGGADGMILTWGKTKPTK